MALSEYEAKILGAMVSWSPTKSATIRELSRSTGVPEGSVRRVVRRFARNGFAHGTVQSPSRWRPTSRGRMAIARRAYREYVVGP
ncbi:helix-turn-helix domain-containing protein [Nocardia sp. NPDC056000]|uniref:helix-turn-helix domain-containing protein n=1 Tax=Nocardia sp. NPDC056000 TaxID=3345674 RepID=UPI0035DACA6F